MTLKGIPPEPLKAFLEDQGFKSLLNRVGGGGASSGGARPVDVMASKPAPQAPAEKEKITVDRTKYETVVTEEALDRWIAEATRQGYVAIDTETDNIDNILAKLAGISLATAPNQACYIPIGHTGQDMLVETPDQLPADLVLERLRPLLEDPAVLKIAHNLKYDWVMFARAGIDVAPYDDTLVMSFDLDAGRSNHGLDELADIHFQRKDYDRLLDTLDLAIEAAPRGGRMEVRREMMEAFTRQWILMKCKPKAMQAVNYDHKKVTLATGDIAKLLETIAEAKRSASGSTRNRTLDAMADELRGAGGGK